MATNGDLTAAVKECSLRWQTEPLSLEVLSTDAERLRALAPDGPLRQLCVLLGSLAQAAGENRFPLEIESLTETTRALETADETLARTALVTLEALEAEAAFFEAPALAPSNVAPLWPVRVLTVDDSSLVRSALRRVFTDSGAMHHGKVWAESGGDGLGSSFVFEIRV